MMKLISGSRIKGITKRRYKSKNGIIDTVEDTLGNEVVKFIWVKS